MSFEKRERGRESKGRKTLHCEDYLKEKKAYTFGRGQTWHRPDDVEAALDKSLEDLGLDYGR